MNTQKWTSQIDETTYAFKQSFGSMTPEQLNWKPDTRTWSIGQNIDHLIVINTSYFPVIQGIRQGTNKLPFIARFDFIVSFMGKAVLKAVQPDRKNRMKTLRMWEPRKSDIPPGIVGMFEKHQKDLKDLIAASADLLRNGTTICSPANRNIVYKLETAFDIIVTHEKRHFEQAKEVEIMLRAHDPITLAQK